METLCAFSRELSIESFGAELFLKRDHLQVSEEDIAWAMLRLFEVERTPVEGAGATALAAVLAGKLPGLAGRRVGVPLCGGNVDAGTFARALRLGLDRRARVAAIAQA